MKSSTSDPSALPRLDEQSLSYVILLHLCIACSSLFEVCSPAEHGNPNVCVYRTTSGGHSNRQRREYRSVDAQYYHPADKTVPLELKQLS